MRSASTLESPRRSRRTSPAPSAARTALRAAAGVAALGLPLAGCDQVRIGSPDSLWLLWLVPALAVFFVYSFSSRTRLLRRFAAPAMLARLTAGVSRPRQLLKAVLVALAALAAVLALAELKYGFTWEEVQRRGVDIVVALDVSDSMLVEDAEIGGKLSRLERAKREIADLLRIVGGDRIGLVAFAGTAFLECPLTLDYGAAQLFLSSIDTDLIPVKGTALGAALRTSLEAFEGGSHSSRAIILITDGEDHAGDALAAAEEAKLAGVRIFAIGIGRDEGAPIPAPGGGFRRDRRGEMVLSRLDETTLQRIALATGGRYVRSVTGDVDLEQIYSQGIKAVLDDQELESQRRQRWEDRFQWLLAVALIALMAEPLIAERRRPLRAGGETAALVLLCLVLTAGAAGAQQPPAPRPAATPADEPAGKPTPGPLPPRSYDDPWEAYAAGAYDQAVQGFIDRQVERPEEAALALNLGSAYYGMRDYERADQAFGQAALAADPALRQEAVYNLGNSAYRQGRLEEAVALYQSALELDPDDEDAKFNLEFVRDEIRRRIEENQKRQEQQQQQQQGGDQQQQQDPQQQEQQQEQGAPEPQPGEGQEQPQAEPQPDSDGDGLPDQLERQGANPTDPNNPDTDGDGLPDGTEDRNASGAVDPGETDPNKLDSDGDGVPDSQEAGATEAEPGEAEEGLSPEEAARYLQSLEEGRPERQAPKSGRQRRPAKDW
jgi:Ca-activated chloride channel family protein